MNPGSGPGGTLDALARGLAVFLLIAFAETLHGVARNLLLTPGVGDQLSRQVGVLTGSLMILAIAWLFAGWTGATTRPQLLAVGALWVALMVAFEVGLGRLFGFSWDRILSDYDPRQGGLMLLGMGVLLFAPLLAAKARRITS